MLEVVFSDNMKGAMKMAKNYNEKSMIGGAIGYIGKKPSKYELKKRFEGKAIGGNSQDVVYIGFSLDVGDISGQIDGCERKNVFQKVWGCVDFDERETEKFFHMQREDLEKLVTTATQGTPIRIWKSNAPYSACAFAFVCDVLRNIDCKTSVVSLPKYRKIDENTIESYSNWGEISPGQFYSFLPLERELPNIEKHMESNLWQNLKAENAPLRAVVNGNLISVQEDFYDHIIIKNIPDEEFVMAQLIGRILSKYPSHPYGKVLKKTLV
jgi:hypothetical protein